MELRLNRQQPRTGVPFDIRFIAISCAYVENIAEDHGPGTMAQFTENYYFDT
jgi:hypothetical protein